MSEQHIKLDDTAFRWDHLIKDLTLRLRAKGIQSVLWDRTAVGHYGVPMGFGVCLIQRKIGLLPYLLLLVITRVHGS